MIGEKLRSLRNSKQLSMAKVYKLTGITDSRLSNIERGMTQHLSLDDLCSLLKIYDVPLISFLYEEGYLYHQKDLFNNLELLNEFEIEHIQDEINFIIKEKGIKNEQ